MIAVIGRILGMPARDGGVAGLAAEIAVATAARGAKVELVGKLGDDPAGDTTLFALSRANVGHAAILRDPSRPTPTIAATDASHDEAGEGDDEFLADLDVAVAGPGGAGAAGASSAGPGPEPAGLEMEAGDLELALRYLTDSSVVVLADPASPGLVPVAADGAAFAGAALIILGNPQSLPAVGVPADATILSVPPADPGGAFAALVAGYAVALDSGKAPAEAWAAATGRLGVERA